jgi:hypothetical protein
MGEARGPARSAPYANACVFVRCATGESIASTRVSLLLYAHACVFVTSAMGEVRGPARSAPYANACVFVRCARGEARALRGLLFDANACVFS